MNIQELINYLSNLDNKERQVYLFYPDNEIESLVISDFDDAISDRLDINLKGKYFEGD